MRRSRGHTVSGPRHAEDAAIVLAMTPRIEAAARLAVQNSQGIRIGQAW
tara:strand:+ start:1239 stop:1385 length:147 start_codon:yes stop_codon:yes gene_type:complete